MAEHTGFLTRRNLIKLGIGIGTTVLLAACGTTSPPSAPATTVTNSGQTATGTPAAPSTELKAANLKVWSWWPDPVEPMKQMAAAFTKQHPKITVGVEAPTDYWTKLQTALAGGAGPDIYYMNNVNYWAWASKGVLLDLDSRINRDADIKSSLDQFWQDAITYYKFQGKNYGLPYMYTTVVMYYNDDVIKQAGLTPPADLGEKFTWDTVKAYANKLTKREGDKTTYYGFSATEGIETGWLNFVRANGGDFLNKDSTKCIIDEQPSVDAWTYLTDLALQDKVSPSPAAIQAESTQSMFMTGKIGMLPSGSWTMKTLNSQLKGFKYNIAMMPVSPKTGKSGGTTNIVGLVLNKDGKAPDESWEFMKYMLSKDSQDLLAKADVLAPIRNDSAELYYDAKLGPANRKAAMEMQKWTTPLPAHAKVTWTEMMKPTGDNQNDIFQGKVPVKDGLQKMAAAVNDLFAKAQ